MTEPICSFHPTTLRDPLGARENSQERGKTMIIDKGLGMRQFEDLLETAAPYIDYIKLGFGTAILYPAHILENKLALADRFQVAMYPGGTFFEAAFKQNQVSVYLEKIKQLGFTKMEISDGTMDIPSEDRV